MSTSTKWTWSNYEYFRTASSQTIDNTCCTVMSATELRYQVDLRKKVLTFHEP